MRQRSLSMELILIAVTGGIDFSLPPASLLKQSGRRQNDDGHPVMLNQERHSGFSDHHRALA